MTIPSHLSPTILSVSINRLAPLFIEAADCDQEAARRAVTALLSDYKAETNEEFTLAADIVHYRLLAVDNLTRSSEPELALTKVLRLRGSAVSLSREAHKAQRKLDKLQSARSAAIPDPRARAAPVPLPAVTPDQPAPPTPAELAALHTARGILNGVKSGKTSAYGGQGQAQQLRKRMLTQTIKQNAARNTAENDRRAAEKAALLVA